MVVSNEKSEGMVYRYKCDAGDVNCEYSVEHEDMEEVRNQARIHRLGDHRPEDFDPAMWNPLIELERVA
jgi:hypothetical protein